MYRYGKRTVQGVLKDGWNALARYYLNNFADGTKQVSGSNYYRLRILSTSTSTDCLSSSWFRTKDVIDLVQGHYIVAVSRDMAPVPRKGGLEALAVSNHQLIYYNYIRPVP